MSRKGLGWPRPSRRWSSRISPLLGGLTRAQKLADAAGRALSILTAWLGVALMMSVILLLGLVGSTYSQESYLRLEGHVQWVAGQTMILATNTDLMGSYVPQALWSVRVDLTGVPQDEYDTLRPGDFVIVTGVLYNNSWLVGTSIDRAPGS